MLRRDVPTANRSRVRQCDHCPVRRIGLCSPFESPSLGGAGPDLAELEAAHAPVRVFDPGDIIFRQGDSSDYLYNVVSGWVDLHRDLADGRRQTSRFLLPGALFGTKPRGARHAHGATAITTASICAIPTARADELRRRHPAFNEHFIWMLERESHLAAEDLTTIGQGSAMERVAHILWNLAGRICAPGPIRAGAALRVPLTQRLLAGATGLTSIHVNRVVRRLRDLAIVQFHDGILVIEDLAPLAALANECPESATHWTAPGKSARLPRRSGTSVRASDHGPDPEHGAAHHALRPHGSSGPVGLARAAASG